MHDLGGRTIFPSPSIASQINAGQLNPFRRILNLAPESMLNAER
jgi:hypothetical protein